MYGEVPVAIIVVIESFKMSFRENFRMKIKDFINEINKTYPDIDKNEAASDDLISEKEKSLGYKLPNSF